MIWTMTELSRDPRVIKKLQEEIRAALGPNKEKITEEDLEKVEYLKMVIEEAFRLQPPAPLLLPRLTMSDINIQGYNIPKNTMVQINTYTIVRDPKTGQNLTSSSQRSLSITLSNTRVNILSYCRLEQDVGSVPGWPRGSPSSSSAFLAFFTSSIGVCPME
ncbi:unnamed protein product [Arabidopsis thaliana]|uniref:(thale cress) hypothetical protein n=1 Tax=Arabidopsis thaliana TaxID=3702 RepID=A0A7G2E6B6_ARATH|nr:unnamed protein product [Arabidopsis thaliana]